MSEEDKMDLEIKEESPRPEKWKKLEKSVKENIDEVVNILRSENYEVIEPSQKSSGEEPVRKAEKSESEARVIGFSGKGGVGKTTLAALFLRIISEKKSRAVLAVDSDPNTCLPEVLGSENFRTLSEMIEGYKGGRLPPRKFKQEFNTLLLENEQDSYDLLPMGRSEGQGCYCSVNNLLKSAFKDFILEGSHGYDYVIFDCEAGIEHISRKTSAFLTDLVIVTDGSKMSMNTIKNIKETTQEVKINIENIYVLANRIEDEEILEEIREVSEDLGMNFLGSIPQNEELKRLNFEGKSIFELSEDSQPYQRVEEMAEVLFSNSSDAAGGKE